MAFWVLGKPTTQHAHLLLQHFVNTPEARESKRSYNSGSDIVIFYYQRDDSTNNARDEEASPFTTEIILQFDGDGMADADTQKDSCADDNSCEIHSI